MNRTNLDERQLQKRNKAGNQAFMLMAFLLLADMGLHNYGFQWFDYPLVSPTARATEDSASGTAILVISAAVGLVILGSVYWIRRRNNRDEMSDHRGLYSSLSIPEVLPQQRVQHNNQQHFLSLISQIIYKASIHQWDDLLNSRLHVRPLTLCILQIGSKPGKA